MVRWAEIYFSRLEHNYRELRKLSGNKKIIAVVKANAYGHGAVEVSRFLESKTDVDAFAVATFDEGKELVDAGIGRKIIVMSTPVEMGVKEVMELGLIPVIFDFDSLRLVKELSVPFQVKIDVGMGRLGFTVDQWERLVQELSGTRVVGLMCHFPSADEDEDATRSQLDVFLKFLGGVKPFLKDRFMIHVDNSAALRFGFNSFLTHSRVGIGLYGSAPSESFPASLKQVMEVKSRVIQVKQLPPGHGVSYGSTYVTGGDELVAVVAFGYADGLPRRLSNKGFIVIGGKRCKIRGRVCMDMTVVSVDDVSVRKGDEVVVFGRELTFDKAARMCGTISYELMCGISQRVKRIYHV